MQSNGFIVTIDGPAGAGKSTMARLLAERLGFEYLDTGAMFRAVALAVLRANALESDEDALAQLLAQIRLDFAPGRTWLNGEDVSGLIRTQAISDAASRLARSKAVRSRLAELQRQAAHGRNIVCEGRDQGTVVFPQARMKFFLTATPEERAARRLREMLAAGQSATFEDVLARLKERDERDANREIAPTRPAEDAQIVDSTGMTVPAVLVLMEDAVCRRLG